ncbi:MAG: CaiB/BaiF CoA-transferase family protein [Hyphomicrobiales bacterium]|nr:CaiB/BaiF CoA-transferase family protein [Hyphomicrobiales bacterium]
MTQPLLGISVLDFSTLLPGPMASLMLAEAGATVTKIERSGGEDMRHFAPAHGLSSAAFMALNGGKMTIVLDLKQDADLTRARDLAGKADVLIEQFRPGVMARLGLGYEALSAHNPGLIYCSITGFGQSGPRALQAGHDLNYQALSGVLAQGLVRGASAPLPPALIADIGGGAYPAVINILLALRQRDVTGQGCHLDVSMTAGAATFGWFGDAIADASGVAPEGGQTLLTGGSPRYRIYATADGWFLAVGALEDKFWHVFAAAIGLPDVLRSPDQPADVVIQAVASLIFACPADHWRALLEPLDCCCTVVRTLEECRSEGRSENPRASDASGAGLALAALPVDAGFRPSATVSRRVPDLLPSTD